MITQLKGMVSELLERRSMRRHRSRIGWRDAPRYSSYLERCRREAPATAQPEAEVAAALDVFRRDGITSFHTAHTADVAARIASSLEAAERAGRQLWKPIDAHGSRTYAGDPWKDFPEFEDLFRSSVGNFLTGYFGAPFKILYGTIYRSEHMNDSRTGSQLWHSDSGPGICVNVMFYLHETTPAHGPLEALPWEPSLALYEEEKHLIRLGALDKLGADKRARITRFYADRIAAGHTAEIRQPHGHAGLVVPFLNNTLHRGGYPAEGHTRTAIVFHCYPSHRPVDLAAYRTRGITKTVPYPRDPAAEF